MALPPIAPAPCQHWYTGGLGRPDKSASSRRAGAKSRLGERSCLRNREVRQPVLAPTVEEHPRGRPSRPAKGQDPKGWIRTNVRPYSLVRSSKRKRVKRDHLSPQLTFGYKRRDGHRAGRPRKPGSGIRHAKRETLRSRFPVHVVLRLDKGLPRLRAKGPYKVLRRSFAAGCDRFGFRLNHYSVQGNHLHSSSRPRTGRLCRAV